VDGSSYLYRAWHALPNLRSARGEATGALYGVTAMLRRLALDYKADYAACVFDARGGSFRNELYPAYKAQRPPMPDELAAQIEPIHRTVRALGWPVLVVPGVEADDVIGTLARRASRAGVHTVISTGDKDIAQLVNDEVELINTMSMESLDAAGVLNKYGVRPDQMIDYLMLMGDTADNIPGVAKVGPKTAAKWLGAYGTLDTLIAHADEITGVAGKNLREAIPGFALTRQLVTIRCDCEIPDLADDGDGLDGLTPRAPDVEQLRQLYETYGFRTWLRELAGDKTANNQTAGKAATSLPPPAALTKTIAPVAGASDLALENPPPPPVPAHYEILQTTHALQAWLARMQQAELVALDTETTALDPMQARLVGVSFAIAPGQAAYLPLRHRGQLDASPNACTQLPVEQALNILRPWLEDDSAAKLLHHAKYDAHVLRNEGITLRGIAHDTMLQAYVLESHRRVNLFELAQRWLGRSGVEYETLCGKGAKQIGFDEVALDKAAHYASEDADFTLQLHQVLRPRLTQSADQESIYQLEMQVSNVLTTIERHGVCIDSQLLQAQSQELGQAMQTLQARAFELAGQPFNLNSPKQLGEILFERMQLPIVRKTAGGAPSTDEDVLTKLAQDYPLPQVLLEYRTLAKLKSTYTDKLPRMVNPQTGRVHTRYAQAAVITGRLASAEPNLQNIPVRTKEGRRVRAAFIAGQFGGDGNGQRGKILSADYSQIELRVMAHVSQDANLQSAFARGEDIHSATASEVFGVSLEHVTPEQRRAAKAINFGLIYGMGEFGLAASLGITRDAARAYIDRYFMRYPGVADYMQRTKEQAREQGYVQTVFGRRLWLPDLQLGADGKSAARGARLAAAERAAINAPMQGTAADLIKMAMVSVQRWLETQRMQSKLVMQVHDELVLESPAEEVETLQRELPTLMCHVATLAVPLVAQVGVGANWEQAH